MTINAFHPAYVETYMPEFMSTIRAEAKAKANGEKFGSRSRVTRESVNTSVNTISTFPKTKRVSTEPTEFFYYSKAGAPKPKEKK